MKAVALSVVFVGGTLGAWWVFRTYTTWSQAWVWVSAVPVGFVLAQGLNAAIALAGGKEA